MTPYLFSLFILIFISNPLFTCLAGEDDDLADFTGGVIKPLGTTTLSGNTAVSRHDTIVKSGNAYIMKNDSFVKSGNAYVGSHETVTRSGNAFIGDQDTTVKSGNAYVSSLSTATRSGNTLVTSSQDDSWQHSNRRARQEADNNEWETQQWKDVETVSGPFVASGPYYKAGQRMVQTDKGLVYSSGNGCVVAPDGFYYRSGNLWVGPYGKLASENGSGNNQYIWGNANESAISTGRGYFTDRGYSWPAYAEPITRPVTSTMRKP